MRLTKRLAAALLCLALLLLGATGCQNDREEQESKVITETVDEYSGIVYVSKNGIIHKNANCSGMKYYKEMECKKALKAGYRLCQNCY